MSGADEAHLWSLYAWTDDPWNFRASPYEAGRFAATADALSRPRYRSALELGCGNGELARRLAPRCDAYCGLDAVPAALAAARAAVPSARFVEGYLPCALPAAPGGGAHDLIVLSEVLYFLDANGVRDLAARIGRDHPGAEVVVVTWRGPTGHALSGDEALAVFARAFRRPWHEAASTRGYRIGVFAPRAAWAR